MLPHVAACVAAVAYAGEVPGWMQRFKYPGTGLSGLDPAPIGILRGLIAESARQAPGPAPDLVVPVPLHALRLRARGFNPAVPLARAVAAEVGAPCECVALERIRDTPSQTGLDRRERRRNVAGAFRCRAAMPETVWLVDDVLTTGATLSECARALRGRGARRIVAVCAARTPLASLASPEEKDSMARIREDVTLLHRPNLGEEPEPVAFEAGDTVEILEEWEAHYLCKHNGRVFNIRKELVDSGCDGR